jgi:ribonuclease HII
MAERKSSPRKKKNASIFSPENALLRLSARETLFNSIDETRNHEPLTFVSIDEVGRGCLAGPVVVCATLWSAHDLKPELTSWYTALRDSKKLTPARREALFNVVLEQKLLEKLWQEPPSHLAKKLLSPAISAKGEPLKMPNSISKFSSEEMAETVKHSPSAGNANFGLTAASIGSASAQEIDRHGIITALGLAASRALADLPTAFSPEILFFDGNRPLKLSEPWCDLPQILVTKGDDHLKSISASSVIAKVVRDRWMEKYSEYFPHFGLQENRGYGTANHRMALAKHGPTPLHRISFLKNLCPELHP